ncbi:single-stranded DNA-binding protein [Nocardioides sp. Root140]|uniref:single-stranded DNA-binding protein n=1 Tax=Nocardioides sp. Root140 TaxID=1736460 RepID=UPI0006FB5B7F|nr:single-stranded DNA-binding protein [Nocardioides sp. Root140]KQY61448.1 hypothetical protein ASD30_25660 [Nocardioides sp. Root140]
MLNNTTVTFAGNLVEDPELRFTPTGKAVADFRVLVNRRTKNEDGEYVDAEPTGHSCTLWEKQAEHLAESGRKGDRVMVTGQLVTESYHDRDSGEKRYKTRIQVDEVGLSLAWKPARVITA